MNSVKAVLQEILEIEIVKVAAMRSIQSFKELEKMLEQKRNLIEQEIDRVQALKLSQKKPKHSVVGDSDDIQLSQLNKVIALSNDIKSKYSFLEGLQFKLDNKLESKYRDANISSYFRSIIPVSYFIQLFELGVAEELQGVNGAYNVYQSKITSGELEEYTIEKTIEERDSIKTKQFILHDAIQRTISLQRKLMLDTLNILDEKNNTAEPQWNQAMEQVHSALEEVAI
ncbi:hypothetical protein [Planomicrobium okeanokoites]|uniref:Uncharacterized protein n=1 Tax=Planomicrobium okeanokoites TaxID=244 RepID=A0ABV7KN21_PLAOK|nr:hypothetical protein [Planomicrobium okeanokoites]TAA66072.1 hypothetical protein D2910_15605 [Planomicrobium okeanokoites]